MQRCERRSEVRGLGGHEITVSLWRRGHPGKCIIFYPLTGFLVLPSVTSWQRLHI